jgi:hypothetical protein
LLAFEVYEVEIVLIGTEYLDRDDAVERRFVTAIYDAKPTAPHRLRVVVALCLELGDDSGSEPALSVIGIGHGYPNRIRAARARRI